jgi:protein SCO1/2
MSRSLRSALPLLASIGVAIIGTSLCWQATLGFQAFTWESYRRLRVLQHPIPMPDVQLQDQNGRLFTTAELKGKFALVNFIYTRCTTLCTFSGAVYGRLLADLNRGARKGQVRLLSISLDPGYDTPKQLREYLLRYTNQVNGDWRVTRPLNAQASATLLARLGVVSIPDGLGGFKHNAAVHLFNRDGLLVQILDESDYAQILRAVDDHLRRGQ